MDLDYLKSLVENLDIAALLPELDAVMDKVALFGRITILIAPLVLLALGLLYFFAAPKEANHYLGYRFFWGMNSVEAWQFTQKVAGIGWSALGFVLTIIMLFISAGYVDMEAMDVAWSAVKCVIWELIAVAVSCIVIDIVVVAVYDSRGYLRGSKASEKAAKRAAERAAREEAEKTAASKKK